LALPAEWPNPKTISSIGPHSPRTTEQPQTERYRETTRAATGAGNVSGS
jgi:hypothetical protein